MGYRFTANPLRTACIGLCGLLFQAAGPALLIPALLIVRQSCQGQQPPAGDKPAPVLSKVEPPPLATEQQSVAERFVRLEALLLRSADLEAGENPARAALLQQAVQLSKRAQLSDLLASAANNLEQGQFSEAIENQKLSRESLKQLLEMLQSENREKRIREQRDEVRRWIEETDRLLRLQSSLRGRTEGGQDTDQSATDQGKLSDKALEIAQQLGGEASETEADASPDAAHSPADGEPQSGRNEADEKAGERSGKESGEKSTEGEASDGPASENDKPGEKSNSKGEQDPSDPGKSQSKEDGTGDEGSESKPTPKEDQEEGQSPGEKSADGEPQSGKPDTEKSDAGKPSPGENEKSDGKPSSGEPSPAQDGQPGQNQPTDQQSQPGQPGQSQGQQSQQDQSQQEQSEQQQPQSPTQRAKQQIQQAQQKMQEAQEQLKLAEREGAVEKQREAEERLRNAIEELEEILRQLREEEIERSLASLETRLRRMLEMQNKVLDETTRLQEITDAESTRQVQIMSGKLALEEKKILAEGERAYLLLREEGSSAAFPEAIEQLNTDIGNVSERLSVGDVGKLTTLIEQEIVTSLEEMVAALVQVQKENREKQQQQQQQGQQQQGQPGDQPLVDKLAELRLIRTLQMRINNRTDALSKLSAEPSDAIGQAREADILEQLRSLSERQFSIKRVTHDIVVGKDQ